MDTEATIGALSKQVFADTNPLTTLCHVAVTCLAKETQGPHGPFSTSIQCFKQLLSSEGMSAWNKLRFVSGGRVQAVIAASMGVIRVAAENDSNDRSSKYVVLDTSKLEALATLATRQNESRSPSKSLQRNHSPSSEASNATNTAAETPSESFHSDNNQVVSESSQSPNMRSVITDDDSEALRVALLATCVYGSTNYTARTSTAASVPNYAQSKVRELRYKAALILAATQAGPLGAHSLRGSEMGNALIRLDKDGWNMLPAKGKLQSLEDNCLLLKPHSGNIALVLDVDALQQQAADNAVNDVNDLVAADQRIKVPDAFKLVLVPPTQRAVVPSATAADCSAEGPASTVVDVDEREGTALASAPSDEWAIAMVTACISLWWPAKPITAAIALAIVSQPERIARMRGGREISRPEFIEKDAQRFSMMSGYNLPRGQTPRSIVRACDLMSIADVAGEELIVLDVKGIARRVLEAAAGKQKAPVDATFNRTVAAWPPRKLSDIPVTCMHNQAQATVRYVLNVLALPDSSETKEDFMDAVLSQLAEIAGIRTDVPVSNNIQTAMPEPCLPLYKVMQQAQTVHESDTTRSITERQLICAATMHLAAVRSEGGLLGKHSMTCKELCHCLVVEDAELWTRWCSSRHEQTDEDKVAALVQGTPGIHVTTVPAANNTHIKRVQLDLDELTQAYLAINANRQHSMAGHMPWPEAMHSDLSFFGLPVPRQSLHGTASSCFGEVDGAALTTPARYADGGVSHPGNSEDSSMAASQVLQQTAPPCEAGSAAATSQPQAMSYQRALGAAATSEVPTTNISRPAAPRNSRAEACQLAGLCFPGKDNLAVCRRIAVQILAAASPETPSSFGAHCLRVSVVAAELLHRVPAIYKTKSDPTPWKVSIQQVLEHCPVFIKHFNMPSDLWMQLNWKALRQLAATGGFKQPEPAETSGIGGVAVTNAEDHHTLEGHANNQEDVSAVHDPSNEGTQPEKQAEATEVVNEELPASHTPEQLRGFAEELYPADDPLRKLKVHAVFSLASFNQRHIIPGKRGDDDNLNYYMPGPKLGVAMQDMPEWSKLPTPKIAKLVEGDPYIRALRANGNIMIHLMAWLLVRNAMKAGLPGAEPPPPPPPPPRALKPAPHANAATSLGYPAKQSAAHKYPPEWHKNPEKLVQLAEKAYSATDPYKPMKLHAVMILASCHKHLMPGPQVGFRMSQAFPREWTDLPTPRLQTFCQGDRFMRIVPVGDNQALQLDVAALLQASVQGRETASATVSHVSSTTAQPNSARSSISGVTSTATGYSKASAAALQLPSAEPGHEYPSLDQNHARKQSFAAVDINQPNGGPAGSNVPTTAHNDCYHQQSAGMPMEPMPNHMHYGLPSATIRIVSPKTTMQSAKDTACYDVPDWNAHGQHANNLNPNGACPPGVQAHRGHYDMPSIYPPQKQPPLYMPPQQVAPAGFFGRSPPPGFGAPPGADSYHTGHPNTAEGLVPSHAAQHMPPMHANNGHAGFQHMRHGMMGGYDKENNFHGSFMPTGLLQQFNHEYGIHADDEMYGNNVERDLMDLLLSD